jgi:hypothetical protein
MWKKQCGQTVSTASASNEVRRRFGFGSRSRSAGSALRNEVKAPSTPAAAGSAGAVQNVLGIRAGHSVVERSEAQSPVLPGNCRLSVALTSSDQVLHPWRMLNAIVSRISLRSCAVGLVLSNLLTLTLPAMGAGWQPAEGPLLTRWAKDVKPAKAHPEYPRPQLVREPWQNLNGLWDYAITDRGALQPTEWDGQILVPFPIESALSGVMKRVSEEERLWYRRTFKIPSKWKGQRVLLHFGAVDWEATVSVNGEEVGSHRGGYDAFTFDVTDALRPSGDQELVVSVWDPTDAGTQPRGKQIRNPHGIWYTPTYFAMRKIALAEGRRRIPGCS